MKEEGHMVFNATFNNISVIWWRSVIVVNESGKRKWIATATNGIYVGFRTNEALC